MKAFLFLLVLILLGGLGYGTWLYLQKNDELEQTRTTLAGLNNNLVSLQGELITQQANAAAIQAQLTAEKARFAALESEFGSVQGQLSSTTSQKAAIQAELDASKARITTLEIELSAANAQLTGTEAELSGQLSKVNAELNRVSAELSKANTNLANLKAANDAQKAELNKIKAPRHFYSIEELRAWLQRDDTDTNPAYASLGLADRAFILDIKALRDGFLLPAAVDADTEHIYSWNVAIIGASIYIVTASTDAIQELPTPFEVPPTSRPLPLAVAAG